MDSKKLLSILGVAGVVVHVAGGTTSLAKATSSPDALQQILQTSPTSDDASAAFQMLAERASGKSGGGKGKSGGEGGGKGKSGGEGGGKGGNEGHGGGNNGGGGNHGGGDDGDNGGGDGTDDGGDHGNGNGGGHYEG